MRENISTISTAPGVVISAGTAFFPSSISTVPIIPTVCPAARSTDRNKYATVVFPFVPVIPIPFIPAVGFPAISCARIAVARFASATCATATSASRPPPPATTATAPRAIASPIYFAPSTFVPPRATNKSPARTFRESSHTPAISGFPPRTSTTTTPHPFTLSINSKNFTAESLPSSVFSLLSSSQCNPACRPAGAATAPPPLFTGPAPFTAAGACSISAGTCMYIRLRSMIATAAGAETVPP